MGAQETQLPRNHGIMRPDPVRFRRWELERKLAGQKPHAQLSLARPMAGPGGPVAQAAPPATFTLIQEVPDYPLRNQGGCGSCWVWASTALAEVALNSQFNIADRLSVQYFQSNNTATASCWGGSLTEFCDWYNNSQQSPPNPFPGVLVPWSNPQGAYADGDMTWYQLQSTVPPGGVGMQPRYAGLVLEHQTLPVGDPGVTQAQAIADLQAALLGNQAVGFSFFTNFGAADGFDAFWEDQPESAMWVNDYEGAVVDYPYSGWGGHMVTLVGWDASDPNPANWYWIVLNQWGVTPTRPNQCFHLPMYMNYGATYTMVDNLGNGYGPYSCYGFETLALVTQPGVTSPAGPPAPPAATLALTAGAAQAGGVVNLAPVITGGSPPLTYQWLADLGQGLQPVTGATSGALVLPNGAVQGCGVLDGTWNGVQVALAISNGHGSSVLGPVTVQVNGSAQNADGGFEDGPGTQAWSWNDSPAFNPIVTGLPTQGGTCCADLTGVGQPGGSSGTLTSALVTLPADPSVPVLATYYLDTCTWDCNPLVRATCTLQVVDASGKVLEVLKTHTNQDVDHLGYAAESFDLTALNQGGTRVALQASWSDPDGLTEFLLDDMQILTGTGGSGSPTLSGFSPTGGPTYTVVTLTGTHFTGATLVTFGRDHAIQYTVVSDNEISAVVPWDAATGPITVTTPAGTATSGATFSVAPCFISWPGSYNHWLNYDALPEMSPEVGAPQDLVQLYGFNFSGATSVTFGGKVTAPFTVNNNTWITATVPAGAQNGPITVTTPGGSATTQGSFSITSPVAPALTQVAPAAASPGSTITLTGTGLTTVNQVTFNGVAAGFTMVNDGTLTAVVPFRAGSGLVAVTNPAGSATLPFTVLPPAIVSISSAGTTHPGTGINIWGQGFLDAATVTIDGVSAPFSILANNHLTTTIPWNIRPTSAVAVTITSPEGTSAPFQLNVYVPPAAISGLTPGSGQAGALITITGQYFTYASAVAFNGVPATFTFIDDTRLTAVVPAGAGTGPVAIGNCFGVGYSASPFTVIAPPTLSRVNPVAANPGATVTLSGSGLSAVTRVNFHGVAAASFAALDDSALTAVVPYGAGSGPIAVAGPAGATSIPFTVLPPAIASITASAAIAPGSSITINGNGFLDATRVGIGGVATGCSIVSGTQLTATVPANLRPTSAVGVTVSSPEGTSTPFQVQVTVPAPACSAPVPASGQPGTLVTIPGQYFTYARAVAFGGVPAATFSAIDDAHVTAVVPAGAVTGPVAVTTCYGTGSSAAAFTVLQPAPACTIVTPVQGPPGTLVSFTGQAFTTTSQVDFGGVPAATVTIVDDAHLTAVVPANAVSGAIAISNAWGTWTFSSPGFTVQKVVIAQAPDNLMVGTGYAFTASLVGLTGGVAWTVREGTTGGSIDASGNYTAPATPGTYHVVAASTAVPAVSATVAVAVHYAWLDGAPHAAAQPSVVDLAYFMAAMGSKAGDPDYNPLADLNGDGVIDDADLALFLGTF
jgi:hypothetical protein